MRVRVGIVIDAPPAAVWSAVRDVRSHVAWMSDAESITVTSPTTFDCVTRVGPFRLVDRMEIVEWDEGRAMGIRHVGLVRGEGRFALRRTWRGRTRFTWEEWLRLPWWMGGPLGALVAKPVLRRIWRANLRRLAVLVGDQRAVAR
ncbi:MAG TPA: SRPBCC family protein [Acidimicrobiales bacterium]|nr:SRPBCC family protein [Acidimicrobiales bacterium]